MKYLGKICSPFLESGLIFWETTSTNCCHCLYRFVHDWSSFIYFTLAKQLQVCINNLYQNLNYANRYYLSQQEALGPHRSPEKPVQINTYDYIISLIRRRKYSFLCENWTVIVLHLTKFKSPSPKDALCQVWLKLVRQFWRRGFLNFVNIFCYFVVISPWKKGMALQLNKIESASPKNALC